MSIKVKIYHKTSYNYDRQIELSPHVIRLRPAPHCRIPISAYTLKITPEDHFINWQQDPFGNYLARIVFHEKTREFSVEVEVIADMVVINPFDFFVEAYAENFPFEYEPALRKELIPYLEKEEGGRLFHKWLSGVDKSNQEINTFLVGINQKVYSDIKYNIRMEPGVQSCEETLVQASGSCRDSGWLLVQALRHVGLAARFVSGYLVQLTPDQKPLEGPTGPEKDFTDLHAWAEVYLPGAGWVGMDPTSGLFAGEGHIPLACTPMPSSAAPISGMTEKCETQFSFSNDVTRIHEDPRVTKPYSEDQWQTIQALGKKVDEELDKNDARLTMGGEPTFVSIDDMESPEWNTVAEGEHKRERAGELVLRLRNRFSNGGLVHYGQGKWYPTEPLPRWQLGLFWRKDGEPIWHDKKLVAEDAKDYGYGVKEAQVFAERLVQYLGIDKKYLVTGYEDVFYYLWEEGRLPITEDPIRPDLKDSIERKRLAEILKLGLNNAVGIALPLKWDYGYQNWKSRIWSFRRGDMFLIPGTSPMGLRLPLKSLEHVDIDKYDPDARYPRDLFAPVTKLENFSNVVLQRYEKKKLKEEEDDADKGESEVNSVPQNYYDYFRTSLCIEPRNGTLYVFLPPLDYIEHYLELISAIEASAKDLSMPVKIEGYTPPRDNRIEQLMVSPDPGVIEVNIHPAGNWEELVKNYQILYEEAFHSRLGTEKFMLDGRHTGSGGGNHITLGGSIPENSPILRQTDVLRSIITYWQHHPGLSYLFAGEFIGPTSQAPRIDEGRDEKLYEMEIAFDQIPEGDQLPYWITDRLFRHLLTDITGNTHRSELCIDKMYSPDSSAGRLGILEMRAFDMPPHFRMSMVQMLLIRSLFAMFWKKPYKHKLVRWGTELHDRFMLSHYVESDLEDVIKDLKGAGFPFEKSWLDPFFEFRFPVIGTLSIADLSLELRKGIEPWHVLGEEVTTAGTARYVDSSMERLQVKLKGVTDSRYVLTCNGVKVIMNSTGAHGEYVAGIRYRAWQPPSALHPTIGVDSPLVFDLIDTWNGKSIGGCVYHVSHPGGRSYEVFPVNAYEAESRRVNRFWNYGHTPGNLLQGDGRKAMAEFYPGKVPALPLQPEEKPKNKEYPYTLDLRLLWQNNS
jgi:uncharacterized protein (DUF2126 family)/transglutaminase-like putative cysteine protease